VSLFESRFERLEFKYVLDEARAARVRRDLAPYCSRDPHCPTGGGYGIHSLYLDTPSLRLHRAKERGESERFKLRIRSYDGSAMALIELKHKSGDVIDKTRAAVELGRVRETVEEGTIPGGADAASRRFLQHFAYLVMTTGAQPTLLTHYEREAYSSSVDEYARATFDRRIRVQRVSEWTLQGDPRSWYDFDDRLRTSSGERAVVLEIKCQSSIPYWLADLVHAHGLVRTSVSKYSLGLHLCALREGIRNRGPRAAKALTPAVF
jgi:SPX domain protein involved in polyphosphate accumulation